ncbi:hypothetical protein DH2020_042249 [Rehmannia glutinosa]|uniref:Uncharacterized protein n=1 Tax=Rehmannia glutinosa TaxID=99300 RepID=A0ABR0UPN2_REHGL
MEARRSGNYEASIWDDDYVQSLTTPYMIVKYEDKHMEKDLHVTALQFRLLRQHGYHVPQEVFSSFMDEAGNFKSGIAGDVKGILFLYEASFLSLEDERILDLAKDFLIHHLTERLHQITDESSLAEQIRHALELPLHRRVQKIEAKWFINVYETRFDANFILLELAKLDFNMVQAKYQDEIKHVSRWHKETGLSEKLGFARHRLAESFLWAVGFTPEPHFGGTLMDWIASRVHADPHARFEVLLFHAYFSITNPINKKELRSLEQYPGIIRWPPMVFRLADDLGTSDEMKKVDVPKSIQCYMNETGCSEEDAREYIKHLIHATLKKMSKDILMEKPFKDFGTAAMNLARISLCMYQYGDGFGVPHHETKDNLVSLIVEPFPMP